MVEATTLAQQALPLKTLEKHAIHFFPPQSRTNDFMLAANFNPLGFQVSLFRLINVHPDH
jgi:hypothetical protein